MLTSGENDAPMILYYPFADCKTYSGSFVLASVVQPLEDGKYLFGENLFKSNTVISNFYLQVS